MTTLMGDKSGMIVVPVEDLVTGVSEQFRYSLG